MTIKDSLYFIYRDEYSTDYDIVNVAIGDMRGMYEEPLMADREINEIEIRGRPQPYFQYVKQQPLSFSLSFAFKSKYDDDLIHKTMRWLSPDYYKPLIFSGNENKIYYAMPVNDIDIIHNGLKQGYITLDFRCNSPFAYGKVYLSEIFDSDDYNDQEIEFENNGDLLIYPEIKLEKIGEGDIKIKNITDGGNELILRDLKDKEEIYIDNYDEVITTNVEGKYRYNDHNDVYLRLLRGKNRLTVSGDFKFRFKWQPIFLG